MSKKDRMQNWTREEIQAAIAKSLANEPDGPNKEYWTIADSTLQSAPPPQASSCEMHRLRYRQRQAQTAG